MKYRRPEAVIGMAIGRWTVLSFSKEITYTSPSGKVVQKMYFICSCSCGAEKEFNIYDLVNKTPKKCQCSFKKNQPKQAKASKYPVKVSEVLIEYQTWINLRRRCYGKNYGNVNSYRNKKITVCDEWRNDFGAFFMDMGRRPSWATSLDRIDNLKGYSKENCRWATAVIQGSNICANKYFEYNGKKQLLKHWALEYGINYSTLRARIYSLKWPIDKAIHTPAVDQKFKPRHNEPINDAWHGVGQRNEWAESK